MEVIIEYQNAKGELSQRDIKVFAEKDGLLKAHCYMRDQQRTFRFDRISAVYDCDTGEEISLDAIRKAMVTISQKGLNGLPAIVSGGVKFLIALAACDGSIDDDEMQAIYNFACNHADCDGIDPGSVQSFVNSLRIEEVEDPQKILEIQKRYGGETYRHFYRAVRNTADADGELGEAETRFLLEV